jgi:hypothetical protein
MKYFEALKIYNDGKPAWCSPRKGTEEYKKVIAIMNGKSPKSSPKSWPMSSPKPLFKRSNIVKPMLSVR